MPRLSPWLSQYSTVTTTCAPIRYSPDAGVIVIVGLVLALKVLGVAPGDVEGPAAIAERTAAGTTTGVAKGAAATRAPTRATTTSAPPTARRFARESARSARAAVGTGDLRAVRGPEERDSILSLTNGMTHAVHTRGLSDAPAIRWPSARNTADGEFTGIHPAFTLHSPCDG